MVKYSKTFFKNLSTNKKNKNYNKQLDISIASSKIDKLVLHKEVSIVEY